jgi:hypothetical protein
MYDLAPAADEKTPRPAKTSTLASQPSTAPIATPVAALAYRAPRDDNPDAEVNQVINLWAPLFLIIGSIGGSIGAAFIEMHGSSASVGVAMAEIIGNMVGGTIFMMIGMWIAAKARDIKLGPFPTALLKLCAISVAPTAVRELVAIPLHIIPLFGWIIAWLIQFVCYFALIGAFFNLDQEDTWYCVKVIFLVNVVTGLLIIGGIELLMMHAH